MSDASSCASRAVCCFKDKDMYAGPQEVRERTFSAANGINTSSDGGVYQGCCCCDGDGDGDCGDGGGCGGCGGCGG